MKLSFKTIVVTAFAVSALASCGTPEKITYFQDLPGGSVDTVAVSKTIRIQPGDAISIIVNSRDPELTNLFNLPYFSRYIGGTSNTFSASQTGISGYKVDDNGDVDFPVIGKIHVEGLTRTQIGAMVKDILVKNDYLKDPVVTVDYMNLHVSVMGEVARPGRINIDRDEFTIYDAISCCGDLSIMGRRDCVKVIRTTGGIRETYVVNLCDASSVVNSPVYYLQQNDIVYVEPNKMRARQSTVNGNNFTSVSFWLSVASLLVTASYYVMYIFSKK